MSRSTRHGSHKRNDGGEVRVEASKVSRDPAPEKRQPFPSTETRRVVADHPALSGLKRKDREEESRVAAGSAADKRSKSDAVEASARPKPPCIDSRGREKHEEPSKHRLEKDVDLRGREKHEEPSKHRLEKDVDLRGREKHEEPSTHRLEKDANQRGSGDQCREGKERERYSERNKSVRDSGNHRPDAVLGRKRGAETGGSEAEHVVKKDKENTEWHIEDAHRNPELEKELEKRIRSRDGSSDKDKQQEDGRGSRDRWCRESDDKRLCSRDDRRNGNYRNETHRDGRSRRDKYWEDLDKDHRCHDDRQCDERSSSNHASDRCHIKDIKEDNIPESHFKKSKLQNSDHDRGTNVKFQRTKSKDNKDRKRSDENEDFRVSRLRGNKQPRGDVERNASNTFKLDSHVDRGRLEYRHPEKVHSTGAYSQLKNSPNSDVVKDQSRCSLKQGESIQRELSSREEFRGSSASTVNHGSILGFCKRDSEPWSREKNNPNDCMNPSGSVKVSASDPKYDRTSESDGHISPIKLTEKSIPQSDRQDSTRSATRHNLDSKDTRHISSIPNDGRGSTMDYSVFKGNHSMTGMQYKEHIPAHSSSVSRVGRFSGSSPHLIPQPSPVGHRSGSFSDLGPYEDDNMYQTRDRKPTSCHKKNDDYRTSRPHGNVWSTLPWPPVANGPPPFQHGPRPPFHSVLGQFPASSLFGLREHMNMNPSIREQMHMNPKRISYHLHEAGNRFSSHVRPIGWHDSVDVTCSQLQQWGGNNTAFSEEPRVHRYPEWEQNMHRRGSGGWDRNSAVCKGKNTDFYMDLPTSQEPEYYSGSPVEEGLVGKSVHVSQTMHTQLAFVPDEITEGKHSDVPPTKHATEAPPMTMNKKTTEPSQILSGASANFCCTYLLELDVSVGLTCPELYKHCMILLGTRDANDDCNSTHGFPQLVKEDAKAAAKSTNYTSSIFPKMTDAVFQKSMSIYKKQIEATRLKFPVPYVLPKEEMYFPDDSSTENVNATVCQKDPPEASPNETIKAPAHQTSEVMLEANAYAATHSEEDPNTICVMEADVPGNAKEQQPDVISDAIVFVEVGSQECKAIVPECRVNVSRIPYSPGSTH